jgi:hypothetical protein
MGDVGPRYAVVVAVGLTVLLGLVAGDTYRGELRITIDYPDRPMATLGNQFSPPPGGEPTGAPDPPGRGPAVTAAEPAWQVDLPEDLRLTDLAVIAGGYLLRTREALVALGEDGEQRWAYDLDDSYYDARAGQDVVLVSYEHPTDDRWPQPKVIVALDPATGETLWEEDEASFWAAVEGTVYMSVCYGGQHGRIGECQLSARDPLTNAVRWSIPTYASAKVINDGGDLAMRSQPPYLVLESFPTGHESRTITTIDPDSGRQLGAGFAGYHGTVMTPETLISVDDSDDNPADGCIVELTGYDLASGAEVWTYSSATYKEYDGTYCGDQPDRDTSTGRLAVTNEDGLPEVLDPGTGEVEWTAPREGLGLAASNEVLVVLEGAGEDGALVVYDLSRGDERWRVPAPSNDSPGVELREEMMVAYALNTDYSAVPVGFDLATGDAWTYLDWSVYDANFIPGPGWLAVCDDHSCRGYDAR